MKEISDGSAHCVFWIICFSLLTKVASTSESDSSTISEVSSVEEGTRGQENQAYQV